MWHHSINNCAMQYALNFKKETTMDKTFDMTKMIEEYGRNVRSMFTFVYPSEVRSILEKVVDAQVDFGKFVNKSITDMTSKYTASK